MNEKLCLLKESVGVVEPCPKEACAFWEHGGAVVGDGCSIERLGLTAELHRSPELATWLLDVRKQLEQARTHAEGVDAHRMFRQLLPPGLRD
jgi:hypothetical protein